MNWLIEFIVRVVVFIILPSVIMVKAFIGIMNGSEVAKDGQTKRKL